MRDLASKKGEEEALALVTTPSFCLSSLNSDDCGSLAPTQVKHRSSSVKY